MKQPDLGLKVAELRQEKGMTQEQLAEHCEVSTRTVQRIESGEVDPRTFTINRLGETLEFDFGESIENEDLWLTLLHLSNMFVIVLIPLLIWSWKKKASYKIDKHGRDVLNFQITVTLILFAFAMVLIACPMALVFEDTMPFVTPSQLETGVLLMIAFNTLFMVGTGFFVFYQAVRNTIRVLNDEPYNYPLSIKFLK